ncbi:MAG: late competence development ComFB family protein [Actinobacteria bacterium]|nr:late competence development ComFB family protein [Actinomycetota bacterium]MCG2819602.1 late competence development ComFB family protein [Actinomycetes bacterium]MBU4179675.1 late competence development ComFB family protein [Actinomycetota bacterium]MBU4218095.1 late competence development ComFB family protein [Actinomycetota bacterium]MBU4357953.1 late competence development ComFB family protein [Actinomycetota bacterium]
MENGSTYNREAALRLVNYMEDVVISYVDKVIIEDAGFCGCPRCRLDVIAMALNDVKPKYVVTPKGFAYARMDNLEAQFQADTIVAVSKALKAVKEHPRH